MRFPYYFLYLLLVFFAFTFNLFAEEKDDNIFSSIPSDSIKMKIEGEEVVVTGQRSTIGITTVGGKLTITPADVSRLPSMMGSTDLLKILELTPSVQNSGDANTNIYVRGGDAGQNLLLYSQAPLYTPGHLLGFFPLFNADHVSSLELSKSAIPPRYGGRLSSVISVEPKNTLPNATSITGNVGLLASQATLALPLGDKFGLYLSGRKMYLNLFLQPLLDATINKGSANEVEGIGYDFYDTNITLIGELSDKDKVTVNAFFGNDKLQISEKQLYIDGGLEWTNRLLALQWDRKINQQTFSQQIYGSSYKNKLNINQAAVGISLSSAVQDIGYQNNYKFFIDRVPIDIGTQYAFHEITPQIYNMTNMGQLYNAQTALTQKAHSGGLFARASIPISKQMRTELGLRYNIFYQDKIFQSIDPRVSLRYWHGSQSSFRLSYSRMHQYMNLLTPSSVGIPTDFWIAASETVPPQSGNEFSFGYGQTFPKINLDVTAEIYYRNMNNLPEYSQNFLNKQDGSFSDEILFGRGKAYGVEFMAKKNFRKFSGWVSYTLGRSERNFDGINNGRPFPARFDRRHDLSAVGAYTFNNRWDMSVVYSFATGAAYTLPSSWYFINNTPVKEYGDFNNARMPNYNRTDLSVNYWFKKDRNGINLSIYNLFMIGNPIYVFLDVIEHKETGNMHIQAKRRRLYNIIPSISWRFKF